MTPRASMDEKELVLAIGGCCWCSTSGDDGCDVLLMPDRQAESLDKLSGSEWKPRNGRRVRADDRHLTHKCTKTTETREDD